MVLGIIFLILAAILFVASRWRLGLTPFAAVAAGIGFNLLDWPFGWIGIVAGIIGVLFLVFRAFTPSEGVARVGLALMIILAVITGPNWGNPFDDDKDDDKVETTEFALPDISCKGAFDEAKYDAKLETARAAVRQASESKVITTAEATGYHADIAKAEQDCKNSETDVPEEYALHYYQFDEDVPQNYFGPACRPDGDAEKCKEDLKERIKHDPMLLSVVLRNFKVLPYWHPEMTPDEVEALRKKVADSLVDWELRKEWSTKAATLLDSLQNLRVERLSGMYYTEYVSADGKVHQAQKVMDPDVNVAIVGEDLEGNTHQQKVDCGDQTVSKTPIPGTPHGPLPPQDQPPSTTSTTAPAPTTSTTVAREEGKDHRLSPVVEDRNAEDERTRPNIAAPEEVIREEDSDSDEDDEDAEATTPSTIPEEDEPEQVQDPEPIDENRDTDAHTTVDPAEDDDSNNDGIPDG